MVELGIMENKPLSFCCDNKPAINIAHNPVQMIEQSMLKLTGTSLKRN